MREKHSLQDRVDMLGAVPHAKVQSVLISGHIFLNRYVNLSTPCFQMPLFCLFDSFSEIIHFKMTMYVGKYLCCMPYGHDAIVHGHFNNYGSTTILTCVSTIVQKLISYIARNSKFSLLSSLVTLGVPSLGNSNVFWNALALQVDRFLDFANSWIFKDVSQVACLVQIRILVVLDSLDLSCSSAICYPRT